MAGTGAEKRIGEALDELMRIPGLCGHEGRVRAWLKRQLDALGIDSRTDMLGNLIATLDGDPDLPSVMLITHMDQLGFVVRRIEPDGFLRLERVGGVPERALAAQPVLVMVGEGRDVPGLIANKSHHATGPDEKYRVVPYQEVFVDCGFRSAGEAAEAGVRIGAPVVYRPHVARLAGGRIAGTAVDDRAGCAVQLEAVRRLAAVTARPTVHVVFSVQEEFNLRGALPAAQALAPKIAIQLDLLLTADTPDMASRGEVRLGGGPGISLYAFHGRGTLNGAFPHPGLVALLEGAAAAAGLPLQRSAHTGALTETAYVQLVGEGVAVIDVGFPCRYTHSAMEMCDLGDLTGLAELLVAAIGRIDAGFSLNRDDYPS
ncbi:MULTISPECIES: M20/M25/M40 family metallo-hydrolase [unclassified Roseitalea]|uniref:M42 family metallopeptidase n=1 Tax=unclassified Roseitalea TaxID=2639107 RepID=UPI00273FB0D8|nr:MULTISPECIES: M20/M25/M40 family metallo-hydrolase [unclassified Roseitalea]